MHNQLKNAQFRRHLKIISIISTLSVIVLFSIQYQTSWAAVINCSIKVDLCNGTSDDDIIFGGYAPHHNLVIHGLGGNDYILSNFADTPNYLYGDDGDDILIGSSGGDGMYGGKGNDKYYGGGGYDSIYEDYTSGGITGTLVNNNDIISGGEGDDYINSGEGVDKIQGGSGNDMIRTNGEFPDFSPDTVNCGSGNDNVEMSSGDPDITTNCESVYDSDR